ncbi:hypothetical protein AB3N04_00800 (plasmid) [Alkalihalophilus sp. As8PL]|uniref:Uncharacterized protein n=1 Tax=Alkalihalophilus sp. As8PL TaxID=3237103 RepID=A0AB39BNJ1_9BACI
MNKMIKAFKLKSSGLVVSDKNIVHDKSDNDFEEITLILSVNTIKELTIDSPLLEVNEEAEFC